ncbi:MAG: indolepyruvate oxidoreductase subunit beta [Chloroflexi bacterium]|nr:indolepyruvate oxidoreductase subunit beta [Chloroflexota bacterium]
MGKLDFIVTGVGGQGVVLASDVIAEAALDSGYDAKKTDTIGMAQRGGGVVSHVRMSARVWSPLVKPGEADIILAFEKLEGARWGAYLEPRGVIILNNHASPPLSVNLGKEKYPADDEIIDLLRPVAGRIYLVNGSARAAGLGNLKVLNTYMLGCLSTFTPLAPPVWEAVIARHLPPRSLEINLQAFHLGREEITSARI